MTKGSATTSGCGTLWVWDGQGGSGETRAGKRDPAHRPGQAWGVRHRRMGGYDTVQWVGDEGDLIYLPLDGKGTDIAGTQIPLGQAEPDLISRVIGRGGRPAGICIGLVSPHCLLDLDMSWVPNSLKEASSGAWIHERESALSDTWWKTGTGWSRGPSELTWV